MMNNERQGSANRRHYDWRRNLQFGFIAVSILFLSVYIYSIGHRVLTLAYDRGYHKLKIGDSGQRALQILGTPQEIDAPNRSVFTYEGNNIDRFLIYEVYPLHFIDWVFMRTKWSIGLDSSNRIVSLHRDDNGC